MYTFEEATPAAPGPHGVGMRRPGASLDGQATASIPNREAELLLLCARTQHTPEEHARISRLLDAEVDWPRLLRYATAHGLGILLHRYLGTVCPSRVPQEAARYLQAYAAGVAVRNMAQTRELLRIVAALEAAGIAVIPFKGPMLAASVYGDVALRSFLDLDVLVRRHRFAEVKALLAAEGYEPYYQMDVREEAAFLKTQMGYEFIRADRQVVIEVHWAFLNRVHAFRLDPEQVWRRSCMQPFAGTRVRRFSPEDLLLYLCAHGTRSFWERAVWICDVAELIRHENALDWQYVLGQARALHAERILFAGLGLAHELCGARLPEAVRARLQEDRAVARLTARIKARLFSTDEEMFTFYEKVRIHLAMRERIRDRVPYYMHLAKLAGHALWQRITLQRKE